MRPSPSSDGPRRFATLWCRAVYPATATSMTRPEFEALLLDLTGRLSDALHAPRFDPDPARAVGEALVAAHCTAPEALPSVLGVIDAYLLLHCGDPDRLSPEEGRTRCARLQHAVSAGFAKALQERTRAEQEAVSRAALTAQAEIAKALHESETRFRAVFKDAPLGIGIADMDGEILDINDALAGMFGGFEQHVGGRNVLSWTHPEDSPRSGGCSVS